MRKLLPILLVALAAPALAAERPANDRSGPQITVTGESLVYATPGTGSILSFGIETRDTELLTAKRHNTEIWQKAAAALKEFGVPDKDVQTDYLSIEPRYKDFNQIDSPVGYTIRNLFVVTLSDPAQVDKLISKMLEIGVNHVNGVEYQTTQFKQHRESARELAQSGTRKGREDGGGLGMRYRRATGHQRNLQRRLLVLLQLVGLGLRAILRNVQNVMQDMAAARVAATAHNRWPWGKFRSSPVSRLRLNSRHIPPSPRGPKKSPRHTGENHDMPCDRPSTTRIPPPIADLVDGNDVPGTLDSAGAR